jgi:hypothetical protein
MPTQATDTSIRSSVVPTDDGDARPPFIDVVGIEGSTLRATDAGLTVYPGGASGAAGTDRDGDRRWRYDQLRDVSLDAYGSVGVIRATVSSTGGTLPLLLLEPQQINAATRILEIITNLMASAQHERRTA